jgi:hypothetical protein
MPGANWRQHAHSDQAAVDAFEAAGDDGTDASRRGASIARCRCRILTGDDDERLFSDR